MVLSKLPKVKHIYSYKIAKEFGIIIISINLEYKVSRSIVTFLVLYVDDISLRVIWVCYK